MGEDGYGKDIKYLISDKKTHIKRPYVTQKEWVAYKIQHRERDLSLIFYSKRPLQQFLVDSYNMIEYARLRWARNH